MSNSFNNRRLAIIVASLFVVMFSGMAFTLLGGIPGIIFLFASLGGLVLWLFTTYKTPIDTQKVIVPYLLTIIFFVIHVYEEYLTDFEVALTDITGMHVIESNFLTVAAFIAPIIWITGAILIIKRTQLGYYFLSFFFFAMMFAELSHFLFPLLEDGSMHYVSGMYTAAIPLIPASYGFYITLHEIKRERSLRQELPQSGVYTKKPNTNFI